MAKQKQLDKIEVKSVDSRGKDRTVYLKLPDSKVNKEAQLAYNKAFRNALQDGAILRQKLNSVMREQGVWSDEKQDEYDKVLREINDSELRIKKGGISLLEAKKVAISLRDLRDRFRALIAERSSMDSNTAEGLADNERFGYLVYACLVNEKGHRLFDDYDSYQTNEAEPFVVEAAGALAEKLYGLDPDYDKNLPENKFLVDYSFADKELRLLNEEGHLVDREGRLINEEGRFIAYNDDGESYFVDKDGRVVSEEGEYDIEFSPFLDDSGDAVPVPGQEEEKKEEEEEVAVVEEKPKPKTTRRRRTTKQKADTE
tara:strand:- start:1917 stop:2858 length:942 start_codon:yes stop_codon:yes gene_type:complete